MLKEDLTEIFDECMGPIRASFYQNEDEGADFRCVFTSSDLKVPKQLTYYSTTPLLRVLLKKGGVLDDELYYQLFDTEAKEFCFISSWSKELKQFVIFNFQDLKYFDEDKFLTTLAENQDRIGDFFQRIADKA